jgi:hypothetical protein
MPRFDRISDPQVAADRLVAAWLGGDRAAAAKLTTSRSVDERLVSERPPAKRPSCPAGWWTWACICARTPLASPLS